MNLLKKVEKNYEIIFYLTILTIFLSEIKLYVPLFGLNLLYVIYLIFKKEVTFELNRWNKALIFFLGAVIINSLLTPFIYGTKLNFQSLIKIFLNFGFLFSTSIMINNKRLVINKRNLIKLLEIVLLINFIQVFVIYLKGGLFSEFISGNLTKTSDTAYAISQYTNVIGVDNKNIWASKLTIFYIIYLYFIESEKVYVNKIEKIIFIIMGSLTIMLLLSRTSQLALMVPLLYFIFKNVKKLQGKYKVLIYILFGIGTILFSIIFFKKFFHIKFDMTDGGFTRLYIWLEGTKEFFKKYFILGGGVGASTAFIQGTLGRFESNMHNVIINIFFELGTIGGLLYLNFIKEFFRGYINKENLIKFTMILIIPMLIITSLQYVGYDNDLIIFLIFIYIINSYESNLGEVVCSYE